MVIDQKAQEISLALIKVSVYIRRKELRERLENLAFNLLQSVSERIIPDSLCATASIEALVRLGRMLYEIEPINADLILENIQNLDSAIRQIAEGELPNIDHSPEIHSILSKSAELPIKFKIKEKQGDFSSLAKSQNTIQAATSEKMDEKKQITDNPAIQSGNDDNPAIRQSAILEKIKVFPGKSVQLKDIVSSFPGVSERTIRYDLQRLCAEGRIERVGQGGPATYYKVRVL